MSKIKIVSGIVPEQILESNGIQYKAVAEIDGCEGCALINLEKECNAWLCSSKTFGNPNQKHDLIFIQIPKQNEEQY